MPLQTDEDRINEIVDLFNSGAVFIPRRSALHFIGACSLDDFTPYEDKGFKGDVYEMGVKGVFKTIDTLGNVISHVKKTHRPCIVLSNHFVFKVDEKMLPSEVLNLHTRLEKQWREKETAADKKIAEDKMSVIKKLPPMEISDYDTLEKITNGIRNELSRSDMKRREFSDDPELYIQLLFDYGCFVQKYINETGTVTKENLNAADSFLQLDMDFIKLLEIDTSNYLDTSVPCKFESKRLWADVVLAKTFKHGDKILKAEGFSDAEIAQMQQKDLYGYCSAKNISDFSKLPVTPSFYLDLTHPFTPSGYHPVTEIAREIVDFSATVSKHKTPLEKAPKRLNIFEGHQKD